MKRAFWFGIIVLLLIGVLEPAYTKELESKDEIIQAIQSFRKERDHFFKNASNSPLTESDKLHFKGFHYFPRRSEIPF